MTQPTERERIARIIYERAFERVDGPKPAWAPGGNSNRQDDARSIADAILASLPPDGGRVFDRPVWSASFLIKDGAGIRLASYVNDGPDRHAARMRAAAAVPSHLTILDELVFEVPGARYSTSPSTTQGDG